MYSPQRRNKHHRLTIDEITVQDSLRHYRFAGTSEDFVPARILYNAYARWINQGRYAKSPRYIEALKSQSMEAYRLKPLGIRQFGAALRRIYPDLIENPQWRVQRTSGHRKPETGFSHMTGPHSRKTRERNGTNEAAASTAAFQRLKVHPEDALDAEIMA